MSSLSFGRLRQDKRSRMPTNRTRDSKPQAPPVHPWSKQYGPLRSRLSGAQIFGRRLASAAVCDDIKADALSLIKGAHAGAFNRADMNKDVIAAIGKLNEAKTFLTIKPLHSSRVHRNVLSLTTYT